jgi:hypothetical protein
MAKRKIRHALVQYSTNKGGKINFETAFRNQVVDIPDDQVERLDELGATVAPDESLERPGVMSTLSDVASDSEITNWVMGATNEEVEALVRERPVMASRIESAHASIKERFEEQNLHLGGLLEIADEAQALAEAEAQAQADAEAQAQADAAELIGPPSETQELSGGPLTDEDADLIVEGNVKEVADYISENPRSAGLILEAEGRRSEAKKEDVRVSIVRAAEAAAGFSQ